MAKATLTLPNGTVVDIDGTTDEVAALLKLYSGGTGPASAPVKKQAAKARTKKRTASANTVKDGSDSKPDLGEIVRLVKDCEEAETIETKILDKMSRVDRTLLPLYIVYKHLDNAYGLTSGDVNKVTTDLGVPVTTPNASSTLSGTASKYVIGDSVRRKGQPVRYKLGRRGVQYIESVISGKPVEN